MQHKYGENLGQFMDKNYSFLSPDLRNGLESRLSSQVGEYQQLQNQEQLTPQQEQRKVDLKKQIDEYYTLDSPLGQNGGAEYTDYLDQQAQLKQQQSTLQEQLKTQQARRQELDHQLESVPADQRGEMGQQWQQRNAEQRKAQESGAAIRNTQLPPELESALAGAQASPDGRWNKQAREQITQALRNTDNPEVASALADQLAGRMQDGNGWAFSQLSGASGVNPRAKALLDNLPVSEAEKSRIAEQIGGLGQGQDWNESALRSYAQHRPGARESIVGGMTDYLANHTSEQKTDRWDSRKQDPQAMESFLTKNRELFRENNLDQRLSTAKLGQARMDMFEGHGDRQQAGYGQVSSALRGTGERAEQAREFLRDYEGGTYSAANLAAEKKDFDTLAQIAQAKGADYSEAKMMADGGLEALRATQRQWGNLNEHGREVMGRSFDNNQALGQALKEDTVPGLAGSVGQALSQRDHFSDYNESFKALGAANTEGSNQALLDLGGHQGSGEAAMDKLSQTAEGRQKFFQGIASDDATTRRNGLQSNPGIKEIRGWNDQERGQYLDSLVSAHGKGSAEDRQLSTQRIGDQVRFQEVPRANRVEGYGRLMAQADRQSGDAGDSTRGLAYQVGGTVPTGHSRYGTNPAESIRSQQELESAAAGNDNDELTSRLGGSSESQLELADSRLRHSGHQDGMVGRLDQMRQTDPNGYSRMLEEVNKNDWGRGTGVGSFLENQASQAPTQSYQSQMPDAQAQALKERLGSVGDKLSTQPSSTAGQMHQDLQDNQQFRQQLDDLYRERDQAGRQGQDTGAVQGRIDQLVHQHEQSRFDSQGLDGRLKAADSLGTHMDQINRYAEANNVRGRDYDNLLMKSAELQRMGNGDALDNMLQQTGGEKGLQADEMDLMMDMARDTSKERFDSIFSGGNAEQSREKFTQMALREMRDYSQGERDRFFGNEGRYDSRGERMTDYLVDRGYGSELLYDSKGGPSAMDRMIGEGSADSRAAADRVLDRIGEVTPADTPLGRAGQLYENRLDPPQGVSGRGQVQQLEQLHTDPSRLSGQDRQLQQRVNADVRTDQTSALLKDKVGPGAALDQAVSDHQRLLDKVEKEQDTLPEDITNNPQFKNSSVGLEASRQALDARLDGLEAQQRQERLEREQKMMLEEGMDSRNIAAMMRGALNSPTDRLFLGVNAKAGVELQAPLFGSAEAFVEGKVGFETAMTETGQVNVSFDARVGAGANAQAGFGPVEVGAAAGAEKFGKLTYSFGSIDEAAKFTHAMFHDVQGAMGMNPEGPRPTYANPVESNTGGTKFTGSVKAGPVEFSRETTHAKRTLEQKKPWLSNESQPRQHTEVDTVNDVMRAQLGPVGFQIEADDQRGDRNPLANGTDLILRADLGGSRTASQLPPTEATSKMVDTVMAGMDKLKPGWMGKLTPEQARKKLFQTFSRGGVKVNGKGALEVTMTNPNNLMTDGNGNMTGNAGTVLGDLVSRSLSDEPHNWQFQNFRSAVEVGAQFSGRARYGTGFANAFAELGVKFDYRDANTHIGSMNHGRMMLHSTRPGVAMDESQLSELEKDGILHRSGRDKGQLNVDAFNYSLGRMRGEFMDMYADPQWRAQNAVLADGTPLDQERFENNIDTYLRDVRESVYSGLVNTDRVDRSQIDAYDQQINMTSIQEAQQFFQTNGLMTRSDADAMKAYLVHMGRIDPATQHEIP